MQSGQIDRTFEYNRGKKCTVASKVAERSCRSKLTSTFLARKVPPAVFGNMYALIQFFKNSGFAKPFCGILEGPVARTYQHFLVPGTTRLLYQLLLRD